MTWFPLLLVTNLATFKFDIIDRFFPNSQIEVIFNNFQKTFDRIKQNVLLIKLKKYGIQKPLILLGSVSSSFFTIL